MKKFADLKITENGKDKYININIWYIFKSYNEAKKYGYEKDLKEYYKERFKGSLFSTHKDVSKKKPLSLYTAKPYSNSYFKYQQNQPGLANDESVQHELFKDIIQNFRKLVLFFNKEQVILYIKKSEIEYNFNANGNNYRADIYFEFDKSEPAEYLYKWNGKLFFEIKYTHAVNNKKRTDCITEQIPMVEHSISKYYAEMIENMYNEQSMVNTIDYIKKQLNDKIYVKIISDPTPICYNELIKFREKCRLLNENNEVLKNQIEMLKDINKEIVQKNNKLELELNQMKSRADKIFGNKFLKCLIRIAGIE